MEEIKKQLDQLSGSNRKYYEFEFSKLNEEEKRRLEELVQRMVQSGARKPLDWAWSEFREGIPQWARFMILKEMYLSAHDVAGNIDAAEEFNPEMSRNYDEMGSVIGTEKLHQFLTGYAKGMLYNMLGIFDEGNFDYESNDSWILMTQNRKTDEPGKPISGLHEDFLEFEEQIEIPPQI
ncbi:hypothetical protein [Chryseobacterium indologenes]|uniref:Uncharacterized protein n=1 Tax=Chryseobacterium indologenes TaxID=253 RepID=A0A0N0IY71_CHRID|nr:hypothetical protein [Chryseobacterium indologenes]KPE52842.1 hypothetical protein AOB46_02270 [Chryseobacterium indologenes]